MSVNERMAAFLAKAASQSSPVKVEAHTDKANDGDKGSAFTKALKVGIPALMLVAATHAYMKPADVDLSVNGQAVSAPSVEASMKEVSGAVAADNYLERVDQFMACFGEHILESPDYTDTEKLISVGLYVFEAQGVMLDLERYAHETETSPELVLAAYCHEPLNWQGTIEGWKDKAAAMNMRIKHSSEAYLNDRVQEVAKSHVAQTATQYGAVQYAAYRQADGQFDRSLLHQTRGNDWISAAVSIAGGIAEATGSRESKQEVNNAKRTANRGKRIGRRIENVDRYKGARKWEQIGNILGDVGREANRHGIIERIMPR